MAAQAWFSSGDVDVAPGSTVVLRLTVVNLAEATDSFSLTPVGMPAGWTTIRPASITLFGGAQEDVDVEVTPPLLPSTTAGPVALSVRVVPHTDPDETTVAETQIVVGESHERRLHPLQPALRGRRTATFELLLENRGNAQANCRLHLIDPTGRLEADFDPPAAGVEPGASTVVRARVRANRLQTERRSRPMSFRVDADQSGAPTASASLTFVQSPLLPEQLWTRVAQAAVALVVLAVGWFAVVRPAVRHEADRALHGSGAVTATTQAPTGGTEPTGNTGVTVPAPTTVPDGSTGLQATIVNVPLPMSVKQGATGTNQYTVPAGMTLKVTDLIVQNPQLDQGTLVISRGQTALLTYNLTNVLSDVDRAFVTPIQFAAGERVQVSVACVGVGDQTASTCGPKVVFSGQLIPTP